MQGERSLVTVLFTDIVGSTECAAELRDAGWRELREEHDRRVRRELRRFGGREINTAGDSFLATFERPARAIACAGAIRAAVRELGLEVRAGLHMGEIEGAGRELGGLALNIGARVAAEAGPGEILVSRSVHDALAGSAFDFKDRGVRPLKGVPGEWRLFAVTNIPADAGGAEPTRWTPRHLLRRPLLVGGVAAGLLLLAGFYVARRQTGPELSPEEALAANAAPGIAVLPFTVHGEGLDVWREGMVDVLSTNLDGAAGLRTIDSRTVLARWVEGVEGDRSPDLAAALDVARRTGARYALIGDAVASGAGVRFGADIYDVRDGSKLGEAQVEGSPDSLFSLVDRLSIEVLQAIYGEGSSDLPPIRSLANVTTDSLSALKAYLEGEVLFRSGDFRAAAAAYERAIAADSTFALAIKRLVDAKGWTHENVSEAEYERAIEVVDRLPAREAMLLITAGSEGLRHIDTLRQAVQWYPDDPDFWFALGDTYFHNPEHLLVDLDEAERVLSRALALDPGFAAFYEHPIDIAFQKADSARVASLIQAFARIASKGDAYRAYRTEFALAFGDSADRSRALAVLDSPPILDALFTGGYLVHPRFGPVQEQVLRWVLARPDAEPRMRQLLFYNLLKRGRFRAAIEYLESAPWPNFGPRDAYRYFIFRPGSAPIPERMEWELTGSAAADWTGNFPWRRDFYAGAYAADRGRWPAYNAAVGRLRDEAGRLKESGDSILARDQGVAARALGAYGLWKRGRAAEALPVLEAAFQELAAPNEMIKWWLGELSLELGRRREAAVYFASNWNYGTGTGVGVFAPLAASRLGEIYADLGEFEKARQSYEYALLAWRDADPEMRPRVEAARRGLAQLPKQIRREGS